MPGKSAINQLDRQTSLTGDIEAKGVSGDVANQSLRRLASAAANTLYDEITRAQSGEQLDHVARWVWRGFGEGTICDEDANFLQDYIERRRPRNRATAPGWGEPLAKPAGRVGSRFMPRPHRKRLSDPERTKRRHRKRMLGGSSAMPPNLRHCFTEGERAVLCIVAGEVKHHGVCDLSVKEIADRAGVDWTTTQNAIHEARRLGHVKVTERPQRGRKNLTNLVEVISAEWRAWIKRGPSAARGIGSNFPENSRPTKNIDADSSAGPTAEGQQGAFRKGQAARAGPLDPISGRRKAAGE